MNGGIEPSGLEALVQNARLVLVVVELATAHFGYRLQVVGGAVLLYSYTS